MSRMLIIPLAAMALCACEARFGNDAGEVAENASAAGRAEEGRLTVEAPGFNLSVQIPEGIRSNADMGEENGLVYPGANFGGIHVQGGQERANGESHGEVELRFSTADALDRVVAWYRDPARSGDFSVESAAQDDGAFRITGTGRADGERFALNVTPRPGGGTEARLVLSDRNR